MFLKKLKSLAKYIKDLEFIDYAGFLNLKLSESVNPAIKNKPKKIIFVCTGNICRSAYAEVKFRELSNQYELSSAGLHTHDNKPANQDAIKAASRRGVELGEHKTSIATDEKLSQADLILIMDTGHYKLIKEEFRDRTKFLGIYSDIKKTSIKDPYGCSQEVFDRCFDQLDSSLVNLLKQLQAC